LSLNNSRFGDYLHRTYSNEFEVNDTTDTQKFASYLDLEINNKERLKTKLYNKRDDFTFPIINIPFLEGNISASPAYGICISQPINYSRTCVQYGGFLESSAAHAKASKIKLRCS